VLAIGLVGAGILFFALFGRRRPGDPRAGDLAPVNTSERSAARTPMSAAAPIGEENVPRWLRASVRDARFWTPPREPAAHPARRHTRTFDEPLAGAAERLIVRYDHVDVYDQPNEAYAHTLAEVGTGDEVEIVELADAWALVRTPHGVTGWLPTMTVGAPPAAPAPPEPPAAAAAAPVEVRPAAATRSGRRAGAPRCRRP
jgi:hypothetical protein